jgi:hypothetical protein
MRFLIIIFLFSCTASRKTVETTQTVQLNGSASHAAPGQKLIVTKWTVVKGEAEIANPYSIVTTAKVKPPATFELWGQQTDGQTGRDSMSVKITPN